MSSTSCAALVKDTLYVAHIGYTRIHAFRGHDIRVVLQLKLDADETWSLRQSWAALLVACVPADLLHSAISLTRQDSSWWDGIPELVSSHVPCHRYSAWSWRDQAS